MLILQSYENVFLWLKFETFLKKKFDNVLVKYISKKVFNKKFKIYICIMKNNFFMTSVSLPSVRSLTSVNILEFPCNCFMLC